MKGKNSYARIIPNWCLSQCSEEVGAVLQEQGKPRQTQVRVGGARRRCSRMESWQGVAWGPCHLCSMLSFCIPELRAVLEAAGVAGAEWEHSSSARYSCCDSSDWSFGV